MKSKHTWARGAAVALAAVALGCAGVGQAQAAAPLGSVTFYTGVNQSGTALAVDLGKIGECQELAVPARSFYAASNQSVDVYFNADCRTGKPGATGDLYFRTGTLGQGNFSFPAVSYRVRATG